MAVNQQIDVARVTRNIALSFAPILCFIFGHRIWSAISLSKCGIWYGIEIAAFLMMAFAVYGTVRFAYLVDTSHLDGYLRRNLPVRIILSIFILYFLFSFTEEMH